jgi:hypothetical protein
VTDLLFGPAPVRCLSVLISGRLIWYLPFPKLRKRKVARRSVVIISCNSITVLTVGLVSANCGVCPDANLPGIDRREGGSVAPALCLFCLSCYLPMCR